MVRCWKQLALLLIEVHVKLFFDYRARATMCRAGVRRLGHTFCWCSLILSLPLRDDRIAASVRSLMGRRCRQQPVLHLIDVHVKLFLEHSARATMGRAGCRHHCHIFCWCSLTWSLPLFYDRIAAPDRAWMERTVQTTASSSSDRGPRSAFVRS